MHLMNKKPPGVSGLPQPLNRQAGHAPQFKPVVAQPKAVVSAQSIKRPIAPPVYRPQATPGTAQPKMANGAVNRKLPVAPPVYRPQSVPKVLQAKSSTAPSPHAGHATRHPVAPPVYRPQANTLVQPKAISQQLTPPTAPPAYRPQQNRVAQAKMASAAPSRTPPKAPPVYRPQAKLPGVQAKMAGQAQMNTHPVAPPVYRPQPVPQVLQTKQTATQQVGQRQLNHNRVARPGTMPGAIQRRQDSSARRIGNVVQRDVDVAAALKTENAKYMIVPGNTSVLYSETNAPEPKPRGLYTRMMDRTKDKPRRPLYAWIPNARFLSTAEQMASPSKSDPGTYEYTTKGSYFNTTDSFSLKKLGREIKNPPEVGRPPLIGALGKNDCYAWADALQNMMFTEEMTDNGFIPSNRMNKTVNVTQPESPADLRVEVGDMMKHWYENSECKYHAATVVAKDGQSLVTLEANVSYDIQKPQFHIWGGVLEFADEAIRDKHGDKVEIIPLGSLNPTGVAFDRKGFETRYERMTGANNNNPSEVGLALLSAQSNLGITTTNVTKRKIKRDKEAYERDLSESLSRRVNGSINNSDEGNAFILNGML